MRGRVPARTGSSDPFLAVSGAEHDGVHDAAGDEGEAAGDQDAADIDGEHRAAMQRDVVGAGAVDGAVEAKQGQRGEEMDWAEAVERSVRHQLVNPQRGERGETHEDKIEVAESAVQRG